MPHLDDFQRYRPLLFSIAYRMLGSASDADDVIQDAWLRFERAAETDVRSSKAYLTTIVTRLCLDHLKSARVSREQYIGPWLPEPVLTGRPPGPEQSIALSESLTLAFLVLLETLSPEERAVFLLREVFEYSYAEIAATVGATESSCRQLFHRAKERLASGRPRPGRSGEEKRKLAERFVRALREGDRGQLTSVLAEDVGFWGDGGGKVPAAGRPVVGRDAVVSLLLGIRRVAEATGISIDRISLEVRDVNYEPAMIIRMDGGLDSIYSFSMADEGIAGIRVVRNPDKLAYFSRQPAGFSENPV
jgi:RNA polymerase sigma-70 factor (ECF subfamily)